MLSLINVSLVLKFHSNRNSNVLKIPKLYQNSFLEGDIARYLDVNNNVLGMKHNLENFLDCGYNYHITCVLGCLKKNT